jgi:hypothetical protein
LAGDDGHHGGGWEPPPGQRQERRDNTASTWRYLTYQIQPRVALIQEAAKTPDAPGGVIASRTISAGYETSVMAFVGRLEPLPEVVTRYSTKHRFTIAPTVPGSFAAARVVDIPDVEPFVAVSQYGIMDPLYAQVGVIRAVADLIPLFDTNGLNKRIVLGGDLNVYDQTSDRVMRGRWTAILALIESLGLVNLLKLTQPQRGPLEGCPCKRDDCWHVETFRHRNRGLDDPSYFTTDYLFASKELADRLVSLEVVNDRWEVWALSDHCPLIATFDL